ncbi:hypothetical protein AJ79_08546 [Helicocarpus griseus UAMH5409]|uniref:Altered inheritance of mitochondria protein 32 n=1 Tax=Helicocarpus griseus UAMH5409 TaxID=1447875 RepID=A0A2B7WRW3_9EURO|nr:hypothetical protein AJ79_08546 [Helicocarpus griseus UAMH5409]
MPPRNSFSFTLRHAVSDCMSTICRRTPRHSKLSPVQPCILSRRSSSGSSRLSRRINIPPPFPVTPACPEPTCTCAPTPKMPEGLEIDYARDLNGTMAPYAQQLLISTGQGDWRSRIEEDGVDSGWGMLGRGVKGLVGRGGRFADPYNNIMITNSSFSPSEPDNTQTASALLFPSFHYLPTIPLDPASLETFVHAFLLPAALHPAHSALPASQQSTMTRDTTLQSPASFPGLTRIQHSPTILICGHGHRDQRCGIMGPVLRDEFRRVLGMKGLGVGGDDGNGAGVIDAVGKANVGLISHIGGHKYAGNVIIYLPPKTQEDEGKGSGEKKDEGGQMSLAGKGIWYGRVEPRHVEGIVEETVLGGKVVSELFRGGVGEGGEVLRL